MRPLDPGSPDEDALVDALADAVLDDASGELALEAAAAAGEDMAEAAASLRQRFLERVDAAREDQASTLGLAQTMVRQRGSPGSRGAAPQLATDDPLVPHSIGRYPVLSRLGAGGMGVVYAAYDEALDRRIAIKVLHPDKAKSGRRRERLLREAQAMARVTHPNVITVHDVGTAGDQIFVAMEYVAGPTVQEWLVAASPSWREIVAVFRQAADGLAALHDAGLIHRDVKPSNMIIGEDGRVRVLDLGLVGADPSELGDTVDTKARPSSSINRLKASLTTTGERVGTPAYMSREQFLGLELTPASDLFSLCIALYEALYGVHPFLDESFNKLQANVVYGRIREPEDPGVIPGWLQTLVLRGLASDPDARPGSLREFSAALAADPYRTLRRRLGTLGLVAVATLAGVAITSSQSGAAAPSCDGAAAMLAPVWGAPHATVIREAMAATGRPYATALSERVVESLDAYATRWAETHSRACREHARGDHSDALFDARIACLERRRQALDETVALLREADENIVEHAGQMVAKLPPLGPCDDLTALALRRPPPADERVAAIIDTLAARLVRAEAKANAGRTPEAIAIAREVASEAESIQDPGTVAAALLTEARASINGRVDRRQVGALLSRALTIALEEDLGHLAAEAMIRRLYLRALRSGRSEVALDDLPLAEAMLSRAGDRPELRALLLNNSGAIRLAAGDREGARAAFRAALRASERVAGVDHLDRAATLANLGMLATTAEEREPLHAEMLALYERHLGHLHPQTLDGRFLAALYTDDPAKAARALAQLCSTFRELGDHALAGECSVELGKIEDHRGRREAALLAFQAAIDAVEDDGGRRSAVLNAYVELERGAAPSPAIDPLRAELERVDAEVDASSSGWWVTQEQSERRLLLARLLADAGAPADERVQLLETALQDIQSIADKAQPLEHRRLLAACQGALAQALGSSGAPDDQSRAAALMEASLDHYRAWPEAYRARLTKADDPPPEAALSGG